MGSWEIFDLNFGKIALIKFRYISNLVLAFFIVIAGIFFVIPSSSNYVANADEILNPPVCGSGIATGSSQSSYFQITLSCVGVSVFAHSGLTEPDYVDLGNKINLQTVLGAIQPYRAAIVDGNLILSFYTVNDLSVRDITIDSNLLMSSDGLQNSQISIATIDITDKITPYSQDDYYSISGASLNISSALGVLKNDIEIDGIMTAVLATDPSHGVVALAPDGSFIYSAFDGYYGDDSFTYIVHDASGNVSSEATVRLSDVAATIYPVFYKKDGTSAANYAKVGDTLRLNFTTSEKVIVDSVKIAGHLVASGFDVDLNVYYAEYIIQSSDPEGLATYSIGVRDMSGKPTNYSSELGITIDKTKPLVNFIGDLNIDIELHDVYSELTNKATDNFDDQFKLEISGVVNCNVIGSYLLFYNATDLAGNRAETRMRTVNIIDSINDYFVSISDSLRSFDIENNMNEVTVDNYLEFKGLYVETSIDGLKIGRITFAGSIDLSGYETGEFLSIINQKLYSNRIGEIGIDFTDASDEVSFIGAAANIIFYHLDLLGYSNNSTQAEVLSALKTYDDSGIMIDGSKLDFSNGVYSGYDAKRIDNFTFSVDVSHFSRYLIMPDTISPRITVNYPSEASIGKEVVIYGKVDDMFAKMAIKIDGSTYVATTDGSNWSFGLNTSILKIGQNKIEIISIDKVGNKNSVVIYIKIKQDRPIMILDNYMSDNSYEDVITQPTAASPVITANVEEALQVFGDKKLNQTTNNKNNWNVFDIVIYWWLLVILVIILVIILI